MKRIAWIEWMAVLMFVCAPVYAGPTAGYNGPYVEDLETSDDIKVGDDLVVVDDASVGGDLALTGKLGVADKLELPEISAPSGNPAANYGWVYVKDATGTTKLYFEDSAGTVTDLLAAGAGNTLDAAYDQGGAGVGRSIDADSGAVAITVSDTDNNVVLILTQNDATNDPTAMQIVNAANAADAISLDIDGQATGRDIEGSGATWYVTGAGAGVFGSTLGVTGLITATGGIDVVGAAGIVLENDATITNTTDTEIKFLENSEDVIFDFVSNELALKSSTGVVTINLGDVDALTGVGGITFDAASSSITLPATGAQDLTIECTGAQDTTLSLNSSGTAANAIELITSAGGIDLTVAGAAAGEDLDLNSSTSINIIGAEADAAAVKIQASNAAGGIDVDAGGNIAVDLSGAGSNLDVDAADGSIYLDAGEAQVNAIALQATNAAGGIDIDAGTGGIAVDITGAADFRLDSSAGSVVLIGAEAAADAVTIDAENAAGGIDIDAGTGGVTLDVTGAADVYVDSSAGSIQLVGAEDATDAINIDAEAGGIDIDATGEAGQDIVLTNTGGSILIDATEDIADAIYLHATTGGIDILADGDPAKDLDLTCTNGSVNISGGEADAAAVTIAAGAGGVDISSAATYDIDVTATGGTVQVVASEAAADQFKVDAQGVVAGDAINLETTDGGILLNADGGTNGDISINAEDVITLTTADSIVIDGGPVVPDCEYLTADGVDLLTYGTSDFDTSGVPFTYALGSPSPATPGQFKVLTMSTAGNNCDVSITNHETSDPEVARFDAADEYLLLLWTGTEWATVSGTCTFP